MVGSITAAGCKGKQTAAFFLDIEKAFNRLWYEGFHSKLKETLFPNSYVHLVASFLRNRNSRVKINHTISQESCITAGVLQVSFLVSLLFSGFANDTPKELGVQMSLFADKPNANVAVSNIRRVRVVGQLRRVVVNTAVLFSQRMEWPRQRHISRARPSWSNNLKYFGHHLYVVSSDESTPKLSAIAFVRNSINTGPFFPVKQ